MEIFSNRVRKQARFLGISDAEVARRAGLSERRYGNYVAGIREPDLATLVRIAGVLSTTPNYLLGVEKGQSPRDPKAKAIARMLSAIDVLPGEDLERLQVQVEALARHRSSGKKKR